MNVRIGDRFGTQFLFVVALLRLVSIRGFAQDTTECGADGFDCGCEYGYNLDGSCASPQGNGGGSSCDMSAYYYTYTDSTLNDDGTLSAWTITTNLDGIAGEGTLYSSIAATLPDGTIVPTVSATTNTDPSVEAYFVSPVVTSTDSGSGRLITGSYINWNCGSTSLLFSNIFLSIKHTYEGWTGQSYDPIQGGALERKFACTMQLVQMEPPLVEAPTIISRVSFFRAINTKLS